LCKEVGVTLYIGWGNHAHVRIPRPSETLETATGKPEPCHCALVPWLLQTPLRNPTP
jgi:hypothetical protein